MSERKISRREVLRKGKILSVAFVASLAANVVEPETLIKTTAAGVITNIVAREYLGASREEATTWAMGTATGMILVDGGRSIRQMLQP